MSARFPRAGHVARPSWMIPQMLKILWASETKHTSPRAYWMCFHFSLKRNSAQACIQINNNMCYYKRDRGDNDRNAAHFHNCYSFTVWLNSRDAGGRSPILYLMRSDRQMVHSSKLAFLAPCLKRLNLNSHQSLATCLCLRMMCMQKFRHVQDDWPDRASLSVWIFHILASYALFNPCLHISVCFFNDSLKQHKSDFFFQIWPKSLSYVVQNRTHIWFFFAKRLQPELSCRILSNFYITGVTGDECRAVKVLRRGADRCIQVPNMTSW